MFHESGGSARLAYPLLKRGPLSHTKELIMAARSLFVSVAAVLAVGCSSASVDDGTTTMPAAATLGETGATHVEYVCELTGGKSVEVLPSFGEIHRVDWNAGKWSMVDGLAAEYAQIGDGVPRIGLVEAESRKVVATLAEFEDRIEYKEGEKRGTCKKYTLERLAVTGSAFALSDDLEYVCRVQGGKQHRVLAGFSEVHTLDFNDGSLSHSDGLSFDILNLERRPPLNQISITDDEGGAFATIVEDGQAATWEAEGEQGVCEKWRRTTVRAR
jgi:hypothetical protein